jgi:hypothetical protein
MKQFNIVLNKNNEDKLAAKHPLLQIKDDKAVILSSKEQFPSLELSNKDFIGFNVSKKCYLSNTLVSNSLGETLGKVKKSSLNKILAWLKC